MSRRGPLLEKTFRVRLSEASGVRRVNRQRQLMLAHARDGQRRCRGRAVIQRAGSFRPNITRDWIVVGVAAERRIDRHQRVIVGIDGNKARHVRIRERRQVGTLRLNLHGRADLSGCAHGERYGEWEWDAV